jgi:hypothetical protein
MDWMTEGSEFGSRYGQDCSLLHIIEIGSGFHSISYPMGTGVKRQGREADHSPPTNVGQENVDLYIHSTIRVFMALVLS